MAVSDAHVFPGFLTPVLTQISFQSHRLLFSHDSAELRRKNTPEWNFNRVSDSQPPGHESDTLTTEPRWRGNAEWIEGNLRLVKGMPMFIQRAYAVIFVFIFQETLPTNAANAIRTLAALIYIFEKQSIPRLRRLFKRNLLFPSVFKTFLHKPDCWICDCVGKFNHNLCTLQISRCDFVHSVVLAQISSRFWHILLVFYPLIFKICGLNIHLLHINVVIWENKWKHYSLQTLGLISRLQEMLLLRGSLKKL